MPRHPKVSPTGDRAKLKLKNFSTFEEINTELVNLRWIKRQFAIDQKQREEALRKEVYKKAIARLYEEDPSFKAEVDKRTAEILAGKTGQASELCEPPLEDVPTFQPTDAPSPAITECICRKPCEYCAV